MSLSSEKKRAIRIAKDLCYPKEIIQKLINAGSESEIQQILISARHSN